MMLRLWWSLEAGLWPFRHISVFFGKSREYVGVRLDRGYTVLFNDRVPFVLMSVTLREGLCRLLCVLYSHRSGLTRERKKKEKKVTSTV